MTSKTIPMQRERGIPNTNGFHMRQTWKNGSYIDADFGVGQALFRPDGTLLSFDLQYSDGFIASIALVPKKEWIENSLNFLHNWLAPIGLKVAANNIQFTSNKLGKPTEYESLVKFGAVETGKAALNFLTSGVRSDNLAYVNIYTKVLYKDGPIKYSEDIVFKGRKNSWL